VIGGRVLDSSALTDAVTGKTVYTRALVQTAVEHGIILAVPAAALMATWATVPASERPLLDLVLDTPVTVVDPLDATTARDAGVILAGGRSSGRPDLAAGQVVLSARRRGWPVVTADPRPLRAIDLGIEIETLP